MSSTRTQKIAILAVLAALAYVIMVFGRIPVLTVPPYLKYDPKDVIIIISGFLFGPFSAFLVSFIVSVFEMITVSETGPMGAIMNLVSTCSFACVASVIYKHNRSIKGAIAGLVIGLICMVLVMLLWNYLIAPIYMGYPREAVAVMLLPIFLPFNLLKGGLNVGFTLLLYKPVRAGLIKSRLLQEENSGTKSKMNTAMMLTALFIIATGLLVILAYQGII